MALNSNGLLPLLTPDYPGLDLNATQGPKIVAVSAVLIAISTIAVILRFMSRMVSKAGLWWDDWLIVAAMLMSWGACTCMIVSVGYGFGKHMTAEGDLKARLDAAYHWFKLFYVYESVYTVAITMTKYSILLFYSRIFKERPFRVALWITTGLVTAWFIAIETSVIMECMPIHALWDFTPGRCININAFFLGSGIPNILLNFVILILPLPMIWTLQIERSYKLVLSSVFLLGGFVVVVSIVRVVILANINQVDITWEFVDAGMWTSVEPAIGVVSACLPIMRSLWIRFRHHDSVPHQSEVKQSTKSTIRSLKTADKRERIHSVTSNTPLNELSADGELRWGNQVNIYSPKRTSHGTSENSGTGGEDEIAMEDLPIHRDVEAARVSGEKRYKGGNIWKHMKKRSDPAELYG